MSATSYTARFLLADLIERGVDTTLACPVYRSGELVAPTSGTVAITDPSGTVKVSGVVTISGSVARFLVSGGALATEPHGEGWRVTWSLSVDNQPCTFANELALVKHRLYPVIADVDLFERVSSLNPNGPNPITTLTDYQPYLDSAWRQIQRKLIEQGRRPWLILSPSALGEAHLTLTLALIFEDLSSRLNDAYEARATAYRAQFGDAWRALRFTYDEGDRTGTGLTGQNARKSASAPIFLVSRR